MGARRRGVTSLYRDLWLEFKVTHQISGGGSGHLWMQEPSEPPAWFKLIELGMGLRESPSIIKTLVDLGETNRQNRRVFAELESIGYRWEDDINPDGTVRYFNPARLVPGLVETRKRGRLN